MNAIIGVLCAALLVILVLISGIKVRDFTLNHITDTSFSEMNKLKRDCEFNLKRTEKCHLVFIKSEE